jgi:acyl-CoA synthetase (AMP-forming)/AMP-acid ligase II
MTFGSRTAIITPQDPISYATLEQTANGVAHGLLGLGVGPQEPVGVIMRNSWQFIATYYGCAKANLVFTPMNVMLGPKGVASLLADAGVRHVVLDAEFLPWLDEFDFKLETVVVNEPTEDATHVPWTNLAEPRSEPPAVGIADRDVVHCLYTSGTTAGAKGVLTSHLSVVVGALSNALTMGFSWGVEPAVFAMVLPLFHTSSLDSVLGPLLATGGTLLLHNGFDPTALAESLDAWDATHVLLLPAMYEQLLESGALKDRDLSSVRRCIYGMAPMPEERLERIRAAFPHASVVLGSGQTECVPSTVFQWPQHQFAKNASWGPPVPSVTVAIQDAAGRTPAPTGEPGEILYRGPHVMAGYWKQPEANAEAFRDGWLHSNDLGHIDEEGVVWFTDRLKDIVKSGGENISSLEVERVLLGMPEIAEAAVIGVPDPRWGEVVTAVVVAKPATSIDTDLLLKRCREVLPGFKAPKSVVVVDELPKTATGKIQKAGLRARLAH